MEGGKAGESSTILVPGSPISLSGEYQPREFRQAQVRNKLDLNKIQL
jgi:hypothetical protein